MSNFIEIFTKILVFSYPIIALVGLIANIFTFVVISGKKYQNTVYSIYYRFITLFCIASMIIPVSKFLEFNYDMVYWTFNDGLCKSRMLIFYFLQPILGWGNVIVSIDRYSSIAFPNRFLFRKKSSFQILVCSLILAFNLIYYSPFLFFYVKITNNLSNHTNNHTIVQSQRSCTSDFYQKDWFNALNTSFVPFIIMFLFTLLTLIKIYKSRNLNGNNTITNNNNHNKTKRKDFRFAINSIATNILFLILNLPYGIYRIINLYVYETNIKQKLIYSIVYVPYYLSLSSIFFTNLIVNSIFRSELKRLLRITK